MRKVIESAVAGAFLGVFVCLGLTIFASMRAMETEANMSLPPLIVVKYLEQDSGFSLASEVTWLTVIGVVIGFAALFAGAQMLRGRGATQ